MRDKVTFEPNVPVTVTLKYAAGKIVSGRFGEQVMWGVRTPDSDDSVMYLDLAVAQKLNDLEPQAGESVCIAKRWNGQKGQQVKWDVWLSPETEKMRAVKEQPGLERALRQSVTAVNERRYNPAPRPQPVPDAVARRLDDVSGAGLRPAPVSQTPPNGSSATQQGTFGQPQHSSLVDECNELVDAFAAVLARALDVHQGRVKPEEVRSIFLTLAINNFKQSQGRKVYVA